MPAGAIAGIALLPLYSIFNISRADVAILDIGRGDMPTGANVGIACTSALLYIQHQQNADVAILDIGRGDMPAGAIAGIALLPLYSDSHIHTFTQNLMH